MRTRVKLLLCFIPLMAGASWWYWPAIAPYFQNTLTLVVDNALAVIGFSILAIIALSLIIKSLIARSIRRTNEMQEMMRVAQQVRTRKATKSKISSPDVETKTSVTEVPVQHTMPNFSVITGGKARNEKPPRKRNYVQVSNDLFFQPVVNIQSGNVVGYDVFRQGKSSTHKTPVYVQEGRDSTKSGRAAFEFDLVKASTTAARQSMWSALQKDAAARLFIPITDALIDDSSLWQAMVAMFKAHGNLASVTVLVVDAEKLLKGSDDTVKERLQKLNKIADHGAGLALKNFNVSTKAIGNTKFKRFEIAVCDKDELLNAQLDGAESRFMLENIERFSKMKTDLFIRNIVCEADVVDCLAEGANYMSGTYFGPPKKLKSTHSANQNSRSA